MMDVMNTKSPPKNIGAAEVVAYVTIAIDQHRTHIPRELVGGKQLGSAACFAIGRYRNEPGYYLFYCDADWNPFHNTWHETVADAKRSVEFEYEGVTMSWHSLV
jgi:hypothetical protein